MNSKSIPKTDSIQELASFWDHHDLTDFEQELEEVESTIFERREQVTLHFESREADAIRSIAQARGVAGAEELIHGWVLEKIHSNET